MSGRAGAYAIDSAHIALHFSRVISQKGRIQRKRKFDVAKIVEQFAQAEQEEREALDRELLSSTARPR